MDVNLANLNRDSWELEDAEARHHEYPQTFAIPAQGLRESLQSEQLVKLIFKMRCTDTNAIHIERMWVIVKGRQDGCYWGLLDNDSVQAGGLQAGLEVWFQPRHVVDIYES